MIYIDDFYIHRYRGLRDLKIEKPSQVNILVGGNNSGKTSVLESISIYCNSFEWRSWYAAGLRETFGSGNINEQLTWLFPQSIARDFGQSFTASDILLSASGNFPIKQLSASYENFTELIRQPRRVHPSGTVEHVEVETQGININVSAIVRNIQSEGAEDLTLNETLSYSAHQFFPNKVEHEIPVLPVEMLSPYVFFLPGLSQQLWSEVIEADMKAETLKLLQFFDPDILDIDIIFKSQFESNVSVKHKRLGRAPLSTFGSGLHRAFTLATTIPKVRNGLLLIDELETAIHTKALEKTFNWLIRSCIQNNIQIFATTHSLEALDAILEACRNSVDMVVYRLDHDDRQTQATRFDKETITRLREVLGLEVR